MDSGLYKEFLQKREELVEKTTGHLYKHLPLSEDEKKAEEIWSDILKVDRLGRSHLYYQNNTLRFRKQFEKSDVFKVIAKMPKGSTLHIHLDCCVDNDWFVKEVAYRGNVYLNEETGDFKLFKNEEQATAGFKNLIKIRDEMGAEKAEVELRRRLCVQESDAENFDSDIWKVFEQKIIQFSGILHTKEFWGTYIKKVFRQFIEEGITRIEARCFVGWLIDEDQKSVSLEEEFQIYEQAVKETQQEFPEFTLGLVIQGLKVWDKDEIYKYYRQAFELRKKYPHLVKAFDLVQEEDAFKTTKVLAEVLVNKPVLEKEFGIDFPLCLHGGESADCQMNTNLYDSILLDTKRIGHGINLVQHSNLIETIKEKDICLEICILSNQVLRYFNDLRSHPLKSFLNAGVKVALSPDDPGVFGVNAVNHDFYGATIGSRLTLQELKALVYNSIYHSFITEQEKEEFWKRTSEKWNQFIKWFLDTYNKKEFVENLKTQIGDQQGKAFL